MLSDFEITPTAFLDGHTDQLRFDLVMWVNADKPFETVDWHTGKKSMRSRYRISVAAMHWNRKEPCWEFQSVGTRFLEHYENGLSEMILDWMQKHIPEADDA